MRKANACSGRSEAVATSASCTPSQSATKTTRARGPRSKIEERAATGTHYYLFVGLIALVDGRGRGRRRDGRPHHAFALLRLGLAGARGVYRRRRRHLGLLEERAHVGGLGRRRLVVDGRIGRAHVDRVEELVAIGGEELGLG